MSTILTVRSPSVGRVLEILVEVGDTAEVEDELVILESMKLEIPVSATRGGEVASIDTAVDAQVQTDEILLTIR